jgi:hypothetical protein
MRNGLSLEMLICTNFSDVKSFWFHSSRLKPGIQHLACASVEAMARLPACSLRHETTHMFDIRILLYESIITSLEALYHLDNN